MRPSKELRFRRDERGGVALIFGLALPLLLGAGAATVEYGALALRRSELQNAADTASLAAAQELMLGNSDDQRVSSVAKAAAQEILARRRPSGTAAAVTTAVVNERSTVEVRINETVASVLGRVMSLPSTELQVRAAARLSGSTRICMVALETKEDEAISLNEDARLTAERCSVFSNSKAAKGVKADKGSVLKAERICSAGGYGGTPGTNYLPAPLRDCPVIPDPLAKRGAPSAGGCDYNAVEVKGGTRTLSPGVYCGGLKITEGAVVKLAQGVYVIDGGKLKVDKKASLEGDYVGFYLRGKDAIFEFDFDSTISLSAPKMGQMAGLLFYEDPTGGKLDKNKIFSDNARRLLGTIYLPTSGLYIDAKKPIADQSAYTVIVARRVEIYSGPNLVLNANYGDTDVPVPKGVGPVAATAVNLSQ